MTGEGARIRIRGNASISQSNEPIIFVDGIRINAGGGFGRDISRNGGAPSRLDDIDPSTIEQQMERGHIDLAIGRFPHLVNNIRQRKLWQDEYACVMRPGHACAGGSSTCSSPAVPWWCPPGGGWLR